MTDLGHPTPALDYPDWRGGLRSLAVAMQRIMRGETNNAGSVTLTANQATTAVTDQRVGANSKIMYFPTTANAAAELGGGGMYTSAKDTGSFTITHTNNAQSDRTFDYLIGG